MRSLHPDQLLTFTRVIASGSFSLAAEQAGISQPAVSQQIKELERRLQLRLIERVGRKLRPTAAGEALLVHAQRIAMALSDAQAQMQQFQDHAGGQVRIGAGATACIHLLPPLLRQLQRANPLLEILVSTGNTPDIVRRVEDNTLDAALVTLPVAARNLAVTPVLEDRFVAIAPRDAATGRSSVTPAALARLPLVLFEPGANTRSLVDAWFRRGGQAVRPVMELGSVEAIKEMVAAGLGWSVLPGSSVAAAGHSRGVQPLRLAPRLSRTLAWVIRKDKPVSRALQQVQQGVMQLADLRP